MMARRLPRLRMLVPAAGLVIVRHLVGAEASTAQCRVKSQGDGKHDNAEVQSFGTKLANVLEAWLLPADKTDNIGSTLKKLRETIAEDMQLSADEQKQFPLNVLMLKAMQDRERLGAAAIEGGASSAADGDLDAQDREIVRRAAHFSRFAAAAYGVLGNLGQMKALVAEEGGIPSPDAVRDSTYLQKWFVSKRTSVAMEDVQEVVTTGSVETPAYFVAVDHASRSIVLSVRGTFSLSDTMVDLLCNPVDFAGGTAHQGISRSALKMWSTVKDAVEALLRDHEDYSLVLTGHSLGAGTAILLKLLFSNGRAVLDTGNGAMDELQDHTSPPPYLDPGRPVHVECYAFAPPPVFSGQNAADIPHVFSFVNRYDCVPTVSLGSLYSLFRTIRHIDQLPLNVYQRAGFVLDACVLEQQTGQAPDVVEGMRKRDTVAGRIMDLSQVATRTFGADNGSDKNTPSTREGNLMVRSSENQEDVSKQTIGDEWARLSNWGKELARFTRDVGEAAEKLCDEVGRVADDVLSMSSEEVALTGLLVQRLAAGGGPSPDEMLAMVHQCQEAGLRPRKTAFGHEVTTGDLVIPGKVYWLNGAGGGQADSSTSKSGCSVRRTSSRELAGIRLSSSMVADHSMDAYEPAMIAAGELYGYTDGKRDTNG